MRPTSIEADDIMQRLLDAADELDALGHADMASLVREAALCINGLSAPTDSELLDEMIEPHAAE